MNRNPDAATADSLEQQIDAWRAHLRRSRAISGPDTAELEDHLREQIASLGADGLSEDEAFLVAVKRMGAIDALTREFAREHSDRLWKQLVLAGDAWEGRAERETGLGSRKMWVALILAVAAGIAIKLPGLFGMPFPMEEGPLDGAFYPLNLAFFTLPFIAAYFAWERPLATRGRLALGAVFVVAAVIVNAFPYRLFPEADTLTLTILHLPIALWLAVGVAYVGGRWHGNERRMDFVRFTGELFIYFVLIALGGGVLIAMTFALFQAIGVDATFLVSRWIMPCGFAGATVVASWLVEAKQSVIENMAPVLTRIFSPLFALLFLAFMVTMVATGQGIDPQREILIVFDLLLVVVFALLLYSFSARDPQARPGLNDGVQLTLVGTALVVDLLALWAVGSRISDFGFTPNRVAALGENVVLLGNLAGSAVLYARFLRGRVPFSRLLDWQTTYLYVLAGWAAVVAFVFPLLFGFR
ncbi:permease prefix domain 1-containing protein [Longimicrobium sp.]|uniref:permease prefix domain 1-containing protein n=1 Tax=Longimicrobium sp. TaxID=2029185 RepID=UPI002E34FF4E|nr:permease prefix domain 1-containing protein [Longimicrobium sp.]HEX6040285.1 permease prefix domain 1-containing protein [Longimicrobium sp.]